MQETARNRLDCASPNVWPSESLVSASTCGAQEDAPPHDGVLTEEMVSGALFIGHSRIGKDFIYRRLSLPGCHLSDISVLSNYVQLQIIEVPNNRIKDLSCLGHLPCLAILDASHNDITDFFDFQPLESLKVVNFSHNYMTKMKDLTGFLHLHKLELDNNGLTEIRGLEQCFMLTHLSLAYNKITEISGLEGLRLTYLCLKGNSIERIRGMESLKNLQVLDLSLNCIASLRGLQRCHLLSSINLENNQIKDIEEIRHICNLPILTNLILLGNPMTEKPGYRLEVIASLQTLTMLNQKTVGAEEKISSINTYNPPYQLVESNSLITNFLSDFYRMLQPQAFSKSKPPCADPLTCLLVLTGPEGCGSEKAVWRLCHEFSEFIGVGVRHTTRKALIGEEDGIDYHFVSEDEFQKMIHMGMFIVTIQCEGFLIGLTRNAIEEVARKGLVCCVHLELEGVFCLKRSNIKTRYLLLVPTEMETYTEHLKSLKPYTSTQLYAAVHRVKNYENTNKQRPGFFDKVIPCDDSEEAFEMILEEVRGYLLLQDGQNNQRNTSSMSTENGTLSPFGLDCFTRIHHELSPQKTPIELASIRKREQLVREAIVGRSPELCSQRGRRSVSRLHLSSQTRALEIHKDPVTLSQTFAARTAPESQEPSGSYSPSRHLGPRAKPSGRITPFPQIHHSH